MTEYRKNFTTDELIAAVKQVKKDGGARRDVVKLLNLDPTSGGIKVSNVLAHLKKQGVTIPRLQNTKEERALTPKQIAGYNAQLAETT